jgi:predicted RNase H-like nuclease (RuvC/YqgF family)
MPGVRRPAWVGKEVEKPMSSNFKLKSQLRRLEREAKNLEREAKKAERQMKSALRKAKRSR